MASSRLNGISSTVLRTYVGTCTEHPRNCFVFFAFFCLCKFGNHFILSIPVFFSLSEFQHIHWILAQASNDSNNNNNNNNINGSKTNVSGDADGLAIGHLFLVGGFAESPIVQEAIREEFKDTINVIIPQVRTYVDMNR